MFNNISIDLNSAMTTNNYVYFDRKAKFSEYRKSFEIVIKELQNEFKSIDNQVTIFDSFIDKICDCINDTLAKNQIEYYITIAFSTYLNIFDDCMVTLIIIFIFVFKYRYQKMNKNHFNICICR